MIKMLNEEILSEVIELMESGIQYRDFEYIKEALIVLKEREDDDEFEEKVDHNYNNDYYNEVRASSARKKQLKDKLKKKNK